MLTKRDTTKWSSLVERMSSLRKQAPSVLADTSPKSRGLGGGQSDFVILSYSEQDFVQATGKGNGSYTLECRAGDKEHHFRCAQSLSKHAVQLAFLKYLRYDSSFSTDFTWEKVEL